MLPIDFFSKTFCNITVFCFQITESPSISPASNQQDSENKTHQDESINQVTVKIQNEIKLLSSKDSNSILRGKDDISLSSLSWAKIAEELKEKAPTFWTILEASSHNPRQLTINVRKTKDTNIPGIVSAACKLICLHNRDLNAVQRLNSLILLKGGAKKNCISAVEFNTRLFELSSHPFHGR